MNLKKSHRKIFFHHGENKFEKKTQICFREISFFSIEKSIFQVKILLEKINFSIEKIEIFRFFFEIFFKIIFLHDEKIFFDGIFF